MGLLVWLDLVRGRKPIKKYPRRVVVANTNKIYEKEVQDRVEDLALNLKVAGNYIYLPS